MCYAVDTEPLWTVRAIQAIALVLLYRGSNASKHRNCSWGRVRWTWSRSRTNIEMDTSLHFSGNAVEHVQWSSASD